MRSKFKCIQMMCRVLLNETKTNYTTEREKKKLKKQKKKTNSHHQHRAAPPHHLTKYIKYRLFFSHLVCVPKRIEFQINNLYFKPKVTKIMNRNPLRYLKLS